jgi:hypothetical protein
VVFGDKATIEVQNSGTEAGFSVLQELSGRRKIGQGTLQTPIQNGRHRRRQHHGLVYNATCVTDGDEFTEAINDRRFLFR